MELSTIPLFKKLEKSSNILIAGAGGGFDIYAGLPLYLSLKKAGKNVHLANLSFTWLDETNSKKVTPYTYLVNSRDRNHSSRKYFPEKHLSEWFLTQQENVNVYAFERTGVQNLKEGYDYIIKTHNIDTIILVDGGTDSLMFGDEETLGTPIEDCSSMAAVYRTSVPQKHLVCLGFGVDHFHGVSHYRFLENVSTLIKNNGFLGSFHLTAQMEEGKLYQNAIAYVNNRMKDFPSIVSNSIKDALAGEYGDHHATSRTAGSELWINPLMSIYWCFDLSAVIKELKYYDWIKYTRTIHDLSGKLSEYRQQLTEKRPNRQLPI